MSLPRNEEKGGISLSVPLVEVGVRGYSCLDCVDVDSLQGLPQGAETGLGGL